MPESIEWGPAVVRFVEVIERKVHPGSIEIGYEPEADGEDPRPGDPCTWYCLVVLRSGVRVRKQARGIGQETVLEALAATAEALGITVRLQYEERDSGEGVAKRD